MFKEIEINGKTFFLRSTISGDKVHSVLWEFSTTGGDVFWSETISKENLLHRSEESNFRINYDEATVLNAILELEPTKACFQKDSKILKILSVKYKIEDRILRIVWNLEKQSMEEFGTSVLRPLLSTVQCLVHQMELMKHIIQKKDQELQQFKFEGCVLKRSTLSTQPFNVKAFEKRNAKIFEMTKQIRKVCGPLKDSEAILFSPEESSKDNGIKSENNRTPLKRNKIQDSRSPLLRKRRAMEALNLHMLKKASVRQKGLVYQSQSSESQSQSEESERMVPVKRSRDEEEKSSNESSAKRLRECSEERESEEKKTSDASEGSEDQAKDGSVGVTEEGRKEMEGTPKKSRRKSEAVLLLEALKLAQSKVSHVTIENERLELEEIAQTPSRRSLQKTTAAKPKAQVQRKDSESSEISSVTPSTTEQSESEVEWTPRNVRKSLKSPSTVKDSKNASKATGDSNGKDNEKSSAKATEILSEVANPVKRDFMKTLKLANNIDKEHDSERSRSVRSTRRDSASSPASLEKVTKQKNATKEREEGNESSSGKAVDKQNNSPALTLAKDKEKAIDKDKTTSQKIDKDNEKDKGKTVPQKTDKDKENGKEKNKETDKDKIDKDKDKGKTITQNTDNGKDNGIANNTDKGKEKEKDKVTTRNTDKDKTTNPNTDKVKDKGIAHNTDKEKENDKDKATTPSTDKENDKARAHKTNNDNENTDKDKGKDKGTDKTSLKNTDKDKAKAKETDKEKAKYTDKKTDKEMSNKTDKDKETSKETDKTTNPVGRVESESPLDDSQSLPSYEDISGKLSAILNELKRLEEQRLADLKKRQVQA